jgi:hypothetical protein
LQNGTDGAKRLLEEILGWPSRQPAGELAVGWRTWFDAARTGRFNDQIAFTVRDVPLGPRHLDQRYDVEQGDRLSGVAKRLQILKDLLVGHARVLAQASLFGFGFGVLAHFVDQLFLSFSEVLLFERTASFCEQVFLCHVNPPSKCFNPSVF